MLLAPAPATLPFWGMSEPMKRTLYSLSGHELDDLSHRHQIHIKSQLERMMLHLPDPMEEFTVEKSQWNAYDENRHDRIPGVYEYAYDDLLDELCENFYQECDDDDLDLDALLEEDELLASLADDATYHDMFEDGETLAEKNIG